ncbi:MAG: SMC-Scp complex subunit ScpB [Candidatus Moranbacteria bacterium]|nr:SMC-Scp complex subunit ScpB [Candidatus Moranbacteria bacterium]
MKNKIEAILFLEADPVFISKLAKNLEVTSKKCLTELKRVEDDYKKNDSSLRLVFKKDEVQLVVNPELSVFLKKYFKNDKTEQLSPAMLEVLSIVVYKGPIGKASIEHVRGVNCSLILRKLAIRGLIDRKEQVDNSRIFIYEPSLKLLKKLGVSRLEDLPDYGKLTKELKDC